MDDRLRSRLAMMFDDLCKMRFRPYDKDTIKRIKREGITAIYIFVETNKGIHMSSSGYQNFIELVRCILKMLAERGEVVAIPLFEEKVKEDYMG